jgi:DNA-binding LacI/PurR family transcriptional regulator
LPGRAAAYTGPGSAGAFVKCALHPLAFSRRCLCPLTAPPSRGCLESVKPLHLISIAEQVAAHLREEILRGGLAGEMPGAKSLAASLGVNHKTIDAAAVLLEREGFLQTQGPGKPRRIVLPDNAPLPSLRVAILPFEADDAKVHFIVDLQHSLIEAGHTSMLATKSLTELRMDPKRVARLVGKTQADAWIVVAAQREILEWFTNQPIPAFALFGNLGRLSLARAGPSKGPTVINLVKRLIALGHRRIVMLIREEHRKPRPGPVLRQFLEELEANGISTGPYNLPDWEDNPQSFHRCLCSLFKHTPPTALLIDDANQVPAVLKFLAERNMRPPKDISVISLAPDPSFIWVDPLISHLDFDSRPWVQKALRWANNVARGKDYRNKDLTKVNFVEGGTIGPVPPVK